MLKKCRYYETENGDVRCTLCPWHCKIRQGQTGVCGVRENQDGVLRSLNYAEVTSVALDPVEKKPLYHFYPGRDILSLGTFGCNLQCVFCQNWSISRGRPPTRHLEPEQAVALAKQQAARGENIGIAYTYNEPVIWYEYVQDTAKLAHEAGLKNVLVTNGIIEEAPLRELLPVVDAMNVDIKAFSDDFYRQLCKGEAWPARRTVEIALAAGCHVEITTLIIPGYNDSDEELDRIFRWAAALSPKLPLHLSRYYPAYKFTVPPTPASTLQRAWELAKQRLDFVYVGNISIEGTSDTVCPRCGEVAIRRDGMYGVSGAVNDSKCRKCGEDLNIRV